jgi:ribosome maturation factor RimP
VGEYPLFLLIGNFVITPKQVEDLILPSLESSEFEFIKVKLTGDRGRLRVMITLDHRKRSITLDECGKFNRRFEDVFDADDDFPRIYALEVSSPGADCPLVHDWQFEKNINRTLDLVIVDPEDEEKTIQQTVEFENLRQGDLIVDDGNIIHRSKIVEARISLPW